MANQPREPLYDVDECEEKIKQIDTEIEDLRTKPSSASSEGTQFSYSGRIEELQNEREEWKQRLKKAQRYEDWEKYGEKHLGPSEGPHINLK